MQINQALCKKKLSVKASPIHGYGVFADEFIPAKSIIEECPCMLISDDYPSFLRDYLFHAADGLSACPFGNGMIYNHAISPNAQFHFNAKKQILTFIAKKHIARGNEITINYGNNWFESRKIIIREPFCYRYRYLISTGKLMTKFALIMSFIFLFIKVFS